MVNKIQQEDIENLTQDLSNKLDINTFLNWQYYVGKVFYTGNNTILSTGEVLECQYETTTIYRFIANTNDANGYPIEDAFYSNFDGTTLTNLLSTRG